MDIYALILLGIFIVLISIGIFYKEYTIDEINDNEVKIRLRNIIIPIRFMDIVAVYPKNYRAVDIDKQSTFFIETNDNRYCISLLRNEDKCDIKQFYSYYCNISDKNKLVFFHPDGWKNRKCVLKNISFAFITLFIVASILWVFCNHILINSGKISSDIVGLLICCCGVAILDFISRGSASKVFVSIKIIISLALTLAWLALMLKLKDADFTNGIVILVIYLFVPLYFGVAIVLEANRYKKSVANRMLITNLKVEGNVILLEDSDGRKMKYELPPASYIIEDSKGQLIFQDGTEVIDLEKLSNWAVLRKILKQKLTC